MLNSCKIVSFAMSTLFKKNCQLFGGIVDCSNSSLERSVDYTLVACSQQVGGACEIWAEFESVVVN